MNFHQSFRIFYKIEGKIGLHFKEFEFWSEETLQSHNQLKKLLKEKPDNKEGNELQAHRILATFGTHDAQQIKGGKYS